MSENKLKMTELADTISLELVDFLRELTPDVATWLINKGVSEDIAVDFDEFFSIQCHCFRMRVHSEVTRALDEKLETLLETSFSAIGRIEGKLFEVEQIFNEVF